MKTELTNPTSLLKRAQRELNRLEKLTLTKLNRFKQTGQTIAVASPALGEGEFISSVEDIYQSGTDEIIVLKWSDRNNFSFRTHVFLEEIFSIKVVDKRIPKNTLAY
ncbi:MAG TPA: hypothetical protein VIT44_01085 [Cyclobacteriaceae bacterium]